jgi:hypothetical protein
VLLGVLSLAMLSAIRLWQTRALRLGCLVTTLSCLGLTLLGGGLGAGLFVALRSVAAVPFDPATMQGSVAPGFEPVAEAFRENFERRGERGAACAVYVRGQKVVDLWGGYRDLDARAPWSADTMVTVFSATKGLAAMTLAVAHSRGWLDYDARVARYWPEFASTPRPRVLHPASVPGERLGPDRLLPLLGAAELPAVLGIGEARAMAKAYGWFAAGGPELGLQPATLAELRAPARAPRDASIDLVLQAPIPSPMPDGLP